MDKHRMKDQIHSYFEEDVSRKSIPSIPQLQQPGRTGKIEQFLLAAIVLASILLMSSPSVYNTSIRNTNVHIQHIESFKENVPRVIFEASMKYKELKGV